MRLSRKAWQQLKPLFRTGVAVEFDYRGKHRIGTIDTIGEGPGGAFMTLRLENGDYKSFSLAKIDDLRVLEMA